MNKITKQQAAEFADSIQNTTESLELQGMALTIEAKVDRHDSTLRLEVDGWLDKDDITSLIRILKAVKATLP